MNTKYLLLFFLLLSIAVPQSSQEVKLLKVNVEGNILSTDDMVRYTAGLREGKTIKQGDFSRSVKRLWNLGMFKNVQIKLDEETVEGISITIFVEENPILGEIRFEGNKKIKNSKIEEEIKLVSGQRIRPHQLDKISQQLKDLYSNEGYLLTEIQVDLIEGSVEKVKNKKAQGITKDIVFHITENKKVKIGKIILEGNHEYSSRRLRRILKETKQQRWYLFWR